MKNITRSTFLVIYTSSPITVSVSINSEFYEVVYKIPYLSVPFTYLRILFAACQCASFSLSINLEIKLTACIISGLVAVKYIRLPTMFLYNVGSTFLLQFSLLNFNPMTIGVTTVSYTHLTLPTKRIV